MLRITETKNLALTTMTGAEAGACYLPNGRCRTGRQAACRRPLTLPSKSSCPHQQAAVLEWPGFSWRMPPPAAATGLKPHLRLMPSAVARAGSPAPATDFVCMLSCQSGAGAAGNANASSLPPAGIFSPPYTIGNGASNLPLGTKVTC